jgi:hypothetical protein
MDTRKVRKTGLLEPSSGTTVYLWNRDSTATKPSRPDIDYLIETSTSILNWKLEIISRARSLTTKMKRHNTQTPTNLLSLAVSIGKGLNV